MTKDFKRAYKLLDGFEGLYSNDPNDRGGETWCGIARKHWPEWQGWIVIDAAKDMYPQVFIDRLKVNTGLRGMVEGFYFESFWCPLQCDAFEYVIAEELFESGVNQGRGTAIRNLQSALNILNRNGKDYKDIKVDGQVGVSTLYAYRSFIETSRFKTRNREKLVKVLMKWINFFQAYKYYKIVKNNPSQEGYILGWSDRI